MRQIAIYAGRFQPFHKGHHTAYEALVKRFGKENVYIATSAKQGEEKNPFTFEQKKHIMTGMFDIPSENIVRTVSPYRPVEVLEKFDPSTTTFITAFSDKDSDRIGKLGGKYFKPYKMGEDNGFKPFREQGYFVTVPTFELGDRPASGTRIRDMLGNPGVSTENKIKFFKQIYGKFDRQMFKLMTSVIQKNNDAQDVGARTARKSDNDDMNKKRRLDLDKTFKNPSTGRSIKVSSALKYDRSHPAYKMAKKMFKEGKMSDIFHGILVENALINQYNSLVDQFVTGNRREIIRIDVTDDIKEIERKCRIAYNHGVFYFPLLHSLQLAKGGYDGSDDYDMANADTPDQGQTAKDADPLPTSGLTPVTKEVQLTEKEAPGASTKRVRKYYKNNPEKVRKHLKDTQDDRVARNRDRRKAVKKHGKAKMKNHDVHHPNGPHGGKAVLAKKDHGPDKKKN